jgi:hypothetical protein
MEFSSALLTVIVPSPGSVKCPLISPVPILPSTEEVSCFLKTEKGLVLLFTPVTGLF